MPRRRPRTYRGNTGRRKSKTPQRRWHQGVYEVRNRDKYKGIKEPYYRSSWEKRFMMWCDHTPECLAWLSEDPKVKYKNPINGRVWNYHPDFLVKLTDGTNTWYEMIEIKPYKQTIPPKPVGRGRSRRLVESEQSTWAVNQAKWQAAKAFCKQRNWKFRIMTEKDLS